MMELRPYQKEAIKAIFHEWNENDIRSTLLVLPTGCHAKSETLLMYNGAIKKVEDIKLNDEIMGPDGTGRTVLHIQEGNDELYKISPENVTPFVVTKDHKLTLVKTGKESELIDMTVLDYLKLTDKKKEKLRLISAPAISDFHSFYSTLNLTVSPYQIGQSISDSFVPNEYKLNTKEVRLEFLKGLLDNKNAWSNKGCFYDTKSQKLAEDIVFLCKSLNINAFIKTDIKNSKTHYKVYITENSKILEKKCFDKFGTKEYLTYSFTVESVGKGDYIGFTVDKDNRYLLSNFLITHNCGKTIVFANVAKQAVESGKRVLILAHRGELLEQAQDKLKQAVDLDTELEKGTSHADKSAKVIVASVQTLYQDNRLLQYAPDEFDYIICDEAHHALSDTYKKIFEYFSSAKILGVTATPDRGDMKSLGEVFESKAYEYNMRDAIENGYLSPITVQTLPIKIDITDVGVQGGDFKAGELGTALDPYLEIIADRIVEKAFDRKIIIFLPLVATAQKMERILKEKGVSAIEVNGNSKNRKEILEDFSNNKYQVLLNSLLVTEGYDEPSVNCIVNLRATKSAGLYSQIVGRGTRLFEGKTDLLILDFLWQTKKHDLFKPANLLCQNQEVAEQMTEIINDAEAPVDLMQAEEVAAEDIRRKKEEEIRKREEALLKRLYESQERQKQQAAHKGQFRSVIFREQSENPNIEYYYDDNNNLDSMVVYNDILFFLSTPTNDLTRFEPNFVWEMKPMTDKQKEVLSSNGVDPELIQFKGFASKIIDVLFKRREAKLCTIKQGLFLKKRRFKNTNMWTFEQASNMMTVISKCHWQVPRNIDPETYDPFKN